MQMEDQYVRRFLERREADLGYITRRCDLIDRNICPDCGVSPLTGRVSPLPNSWSELLVGCRSCGWSLYQEDHSYRRRINETLCDCKRRQGLTENALWLLYKSKIDAQASAELQSRLLASLDDGAMINNNHLAVRACTELDPIVNLEALAALVGDQEFQRVRRSFVPVEILQVKLSPQYQKDSLAAPPIQTDGSIRLSEILELLVRRHRVSQARGVELALTRYPERNQNFSAISCEPDHVMPQPTWSDLERVCGRNFVESIRSALPQNPVRRLEIVAADAAYTDSTRPQVKILHRNSDITFNAPVPMTSGRKPGRQGPFRTVR